MANRGVPAGPVYPTGGASWTQAMKYRLASVLGVAAALTIGGQSIASAQSCRGNQQSMLAAELLFGRRTAGGGMVSEAAWARFLAREITPRFPDGLTVLDAAGQWREPARGRIVREPSKVVLIVFRDHPQKQEHLDTIADAYKRRFKQRSVGIVIKPACASF
jgi:hypothetical protein